MANIIPFQNELSTALPIILGNKDYKIYQETIFRIDDLLCDSGIEKQIMKNFLDEAEKETKELSYKNQIKIQEKARLSFRCTLLRSLLTVSYRALACRIAESPLLQKFCGIDRIDKIKVPSKSSLERYEKYFTDEKIKEIVITLVKTANCNSSLLQLKEDIDLSNVFIDLTCIKANIHFPVDWVLLRDATITLMKAVKIIREHGIKNRMCNPKDFIKEINKLSIRMTHVKYKKGSKKSRKYILRLMKKLLKKIRNHAKIHRDLLSERWDETELSQRQAENIIKRMDTILNKLPQAIKQAHERIIGERKVSDKEKILSLYEPDIHVIVRGKSGARVEFGNILLLCEQKDGLIIDWELYKDKVPADCKTIIPSVERIKNAFDISIKSVTGDRGCWDKDNAEYLAKNKVHNYICPRSVIELQERLKDESFCGHQTRRAQTEGRIGIFKNCFLGNPLKSKGFINRDRNLSLSVLAHNLWVLARLPKIEEEKALKIS